MPPIPSPRTSVRDILSHLAARSPRLLDTSTPTPPTTTLTQKFHALASRTHLLPRLATDVSTVPEGYGRTPSGPSPGAVAGIVLGSVAGFILLLWVTYWCVNLGSPRPDGEAGSVSGVGVGVGAGGSSSVVSYRSRPRVRRHHRRSHNSRAHSSPQYSPHRRKETIEITRRDNRASVRRGAAAAVSRSSTPPRAPDVDQIVVLEEHDRSRSRSRSRSRPRPPPPASADDEIVVLEEHSPPRRRESRGYRRRSSERRSRDVEGYRFSGGETPSRNISRRSSSRR